MTPIVYVLEEWKGANSPLFLFFIFSENSVASSVSLYHIYTDSGYEF